MKILKKILIIILFSLPVSNSFGAVVTLLQNNTFDDTNTEINGIHFNNDGTKLFTSYFAASGGFHFVNEYNLSKPYDISTRVYAGDSERCQLGDSENNTNGSNPNSALHDLEFSDDGMMLFTATRDATDNDDDGDKVFRFDLASPYDVSTCKYAQETTDLDSEALTQGSKVGSFTFSHSNNRLQSIEFNNDGTKLFLGWTAANGVLEYRLGVPYDITTLELVTTAGMDLSGTLSTNQSSMRFSSNGKRLFIASHTNTEQSVTQVSLTSPYDTSSFTIDGEFAIEVIDGKDETRGIAFSGNGLKMYTGDDGLAQIFEFDLTCPFNIIEGNCPAITEGDRTGMAEAQMELARRTIDHSTNSALNRLKWIRRNKDKQDLSNLQIDIDFSNRMLASLTEAVKTAATKKNKPLKDKNVFYWSEGSITVGKMGNTNTSTSKEINANSFTVGADKFTENDGIIGWAFRYGNDHTKVGYGGSNLNADTFNLTLYNTRPSSTDDKHVDTIFGIGKIDMDMLNFLDGVNLTANRSGRQMYGTVKLKDEIIKNKLTIIPSAQIDFGHTIFDSYNEVGKTAMSFKRQHVKSRNLRAAIAAVDKVENEKYSIKRHGKLEYQANLKRSSNIKYTYVDEPSKAFNTKLQSGSLHNINGEVGIDIIFPENYSLFIIYERKQAISHGNFNKGHNTGYTDNLYIALGYLPGKNTEYAFKLNGSENLMSKLEIKKDIKGFDLIFNLNDDLTNLGDAREAYIELNKVF